MSHVPKSTLTGPRTDRWPVADATDCIEDVWGGIRLVSRRENHGDARTSGYMNGTLLPSLGFGLRYTVLTIVQWS